MAMSRQEMEEWLEVLVKNAADADDAARDYEKGGTRESLERIETHGKLMTRAAKELQEWHT
jgi:hypothetical protein